MNTRRHYYRKNKFKINRNKRRTLDPKLDYVFKRIFGHKGNEEITKDLISSILNKKITKLKLDVNPILEKDLSDDKIGILDIRAVIDNNINCNIEMQLVDRKNIEKRLLFYWSKLYSQEFKSGRDYNELNKTIVILISDYNLENLSKIKNYISKWQIREENNPKVILTDVLEIYILELRKFNPEFNNSKQLNSWVKFLKEPSEVVDMANKNVKKAQKVLEEISQDEEERFWAEQRLIRIADEKAIADAGYDKGLNTGIEHGIKRGSKLKEIEIAKSMLEENFDIATIMKLTKLTKKEVENLK